MVFSTIEWHENCLKNMKHYAEREERILKLNADKITELNIKIKLLEFQIKMAKQEGKKSFDSEKYQLKLERK